MRSLFLRLLFILFLSVTGQELWGQYLELRFIPQTSSQLQVWLRPGLFSQGENLILTIENKEKTILRSKRFVLDQDSISALIWELALPAGSYSASIHSTKPPFGESRSKITIPKKGTPLASSLILSLEEIEDFTRATSHVPVYLSSVKTLHFALSYQNCAQDQLSVRAILYKDERGNQEATYASLEQIAAVFRLQGGKAVFRGRFRLDALEAGNYLIEVLAYEDDRIIPELERSREFSLRWAGQEALLDSPSTAIERMVHIAGEKWVTEKLSLNATQQRDALSEFWKKRAPKEPELAMARYFQRLDAAIDRFSASQTNLCRIFSLYGKAQVRTFSKGNSEFLRWFYPASGIVFLFKRDMNQGEDGLFELVH